MKSWNLLDENLLLIPFMVTDKQSVYMKKELQTLQFSSLTNWVCLDISFQIYLRGRIFPQWRFFFFFFKSQYLCYTADSACFSRTVLAPTTTDARCLWIWFKTSIHPCIVLKVVTILRDNIVYSSTVHLHRVHELHMHEEQALWVQPYM